MDKNNFDNIYIVYQKISQKKFINVEDVLMEIEKEGINLDELGRKLSLHMTHIMMYANRRLYPHLIQPYLFWNTNISNMSMYDILTYFTGLLISNENMMH